MLKKMITPNVRQKLLTKNWFYIIGLHLWAVMSIPSPSWQDNPPPKKNKTKKNLHFNNIHYIIYISDTDH